MPDDEDDDDLEDLADLDPEDVDLWRKVGERLTDEQQQAIITATREGSAALKAIDAQRPVDQVARRRATNEMFRKVGEAMGLDPDDIAAILDPRKKLH